MVLLMYRNFKFDAFDDCLEQFSKEELAYIINYNLSIMRDYVEAFPGKESAVVRQHIIATLELIRQLNANHMELDELALAKMYGQKQQQSIYLDADNGSSKKLLN